MTKRIVASLDGLPKSGKSRFLLSFPAPMIILDYNQGIEEHATWAKSELGVKVQWDPPGKALGALDPNEIRVVPVGFDELEPNLAQARQALDRLKSKYIEGLKLLTQVGGGTLAIDTGSELWQHISYVKTVESAKGDLDKVAPRHYAEANKMFRQFILIPKMKHPNINLVLTHHMTPEWGMVMNENGRSTLQPTGDLKVNSQKEVSGLVQLVIQMERVGSGDQTRHIGRIIECREDTGLIGVEMISGTKMPPSYSTLVKLLGG